MSDYAEEPGRDYRKERDAAYTERNRLVAALARLLSSSTPPPCVDCATSGMAGFCNHRGPAAWLAEHDPSDAGWDPEWRTIVFIEGPTGQLSWHLHDSDVPLFDGLPRGPNSWDGHSTPEKYERVARLGRSPSPGTGTAAVPTEPRCPCDYSASATVCQEPLPTGETVCLYCKDVCKYPGPAPEPVKPPATWEPCKTCNGKGWVIGWVEAHPYQEGCPACFGTGRTPAAGTAPKGEK